MVGREVNKNCNVFERALGTEDVISIYCRINFYFYPWSRSVLMDRVPATEPKVHTLC